MSRYFLEVSYNGANYSGVQIQKNAVTIQAAVEQALEVYFHQHIDTICSSRTDAGVHALQNFFHFDFEQLIPNKFLYNLNAILPKDVAVKNIFLAPPNSHSRFDAVSREYKYCVYRMKNPFILGRAYYFPFSLNMQKLSCAAELILSYSDFTTFSKKNTQVRDFNCSIFQSKWSQEKDCLVYEVKANRFLRGMVRGLVGTMLQVGRGRIELVDFENIIKAQDCRKADFSVPGYGLFLKSVNYPEGLLSKL